MTTISEWWMWLGFFVFIGIMIAVDLFLLGGRKAHRISSKEALSWVIVWVTLALTFTLLLWWYLAHSVGQAVANQKALEFLTGYLIEESLSVDNMFVFVMIFNYFAVPAEYQRRVLIFGVLGAIVLRLVMILLGVWVVSKFHWVLYVFGLILMVTGIKMFIFADKKPDLDKNPILQWMRNHLRLTGKFHDENFFIRQNKMLYATPLFLVLVLIEISDVIFALDSIPAVFSVTHDPFIAFTSNIFAILGLRALYFLVANMTDRFHLLKHGLAFILVFIGLKMLIAHWFKIPIFIALGVVAVTLILCVLLSIYSPFSLVKKKK